MDLFPDDDRLCDEAGDESFLQMTHHEAAHAIVARLVGVPVAEFKVSQRRPEDRIDRLLSNNGCSFCNNVPAPYNGAHWHERALIKRSGQIGEARYCGTTGREPTVASADNRQLEILFRDHAAMGDPNDEGKVEFDRFLQALDQRITGWLDAPDASATFEKLIRLVIEQRKDQGDGHYICELTGAAVETAMADLPIARQTLIDWP